MTAVPAHRSSETGTAKVFADPGALMKLASLELRVRAVVEGLSRGLHRSPFHGFSVEFTEYRPYTPGDDVRALDWRLYARSDRDFIKKYEDETNLRCQFVVDLSASMAFGSLGYPKSAYQAVVAATLATFLSHQGDAVGVTTFAGDVLDYLPPRQRPGHLRQLLGLLERKSDGRDTAVGWALEKFAERVRRRSLVVLLSDLMVDVPSFERPLTGLRSAGHEVALFRVLDPAELDLSIDGPTQLRDMETGQRLFVEPNASRASYRRALAAHQDDVEAMCARLGVDYVLATTDRPVELPLLEYLHLRAQRRRR